MKLIEGVITEEYANYKMEVTLESHENIEKLERYLEQYHKCIITPIVGRPKKLTDEVLKNLIEDYAKMKSKWLRSIDCKSITF